MTVMAERGGLRVVRAPWSVTDFWLAEADGAAPSPVTVLERVLAAAPGTLALAALELFSPQRLDAECRVLLLRAWERQAAWVAARQLPVVAAVGDASYGPGLDPDKDWAREEIAAALRLSSGTAQRRLDVARDLLGRLPLTAAALEAGQIGYYHAAAVVELTEQLTDEQAGQVEERVVRRFPTATVADLRRALRRAVLSVDPDGAEKRRRLAETTRRVTPYPICDDMAGLDIQLTAEDRELVLATLRAYAGRQAPGDDRPLATRMADVLVDLFRRALLDPLGPRQHGRPVRLGVLIPWDTLTGLRDDPGDLAGWGPIPAPVARRLAADAEWQLFTTDPETGRLIGVGRRRYLPGSDLIEYLLGRSPRCEFPGCRMPADRCDIDHTRRWADGGSTDPDNLGPLCPRHHHLRHEGGWQVTRAADETLTWTSPANQRYVVPPPRHPPDAER